MHRLWIIIEYNTNVFLNIFPSAYNLDLILIIFYIVKIGKLIVGIISGKWRSRNEKEILSSTRESIFTCFRYENESQLKLSL